MIKLFLKHSIFLLFILLISGCDNTVECIEPDDWGGQVKYTISGKNNGLYDPGPDYTEIGRWNSTGFLLDGSPVVGVVKNYVTVESARSCNNIKSNCASATGGYCPENTWTAWFSAWSQDYPVCTYIEGNWCPTGASMSGEVRVETLPCLFNRGIGLFAVVSDSYETAPDSINPFSGSSVCSESNITNCFLHVGEQSQNPTFYDNYCPAGGFVLEPPEECASGNYQCGLNFKILDRYYHDNAGEYNLIFKQGVKSKPHGVISAFAIKVTSIICKSTRSMYKQIVQENSYRSYVRVLLILFVAFLGVGFIIGVINMTHSELIVVVLKMAIVIQVATSTASWDFFNNNFFSFFTNGVGEITGILFGQGAQASPGANIGLGQATDCAANVAGIQAFDDALTKLFSYETTRKILSLIVWKIYGFIYVLALYVVIIVVIYVMIKSVLLFFVSYLALSIIIVLAPIFIPFILFKLTKSFFDNWLKQLISYFIQPIIILTFAFFMITLLMNQLQFLLGYRVCWKEWFHIPVIDVTFYAWQSDYNNDTKGCIATPNAIMEEDQNGNYVIADAPGSGSSACSSDSALKYSGKCTPYMCSQNRYIGFPYLDPSDNIDVNRINELQQNDLIDIKDLIVLFIMLWFMIKFNAIVPELAKRLSGSPQSSTDLGEIGAGMGKDIRKFSKKAGYKALDVAYKSLVKKKHRQKISELREKFLKAPEGERASEKKSLQEKRDKMFKKLKSEALNINISLEEKSKNAKQIKELDTRIEKLDKEIKAGYDGSEMSRSFLGRSAETGRKITGVKKNKK